MLSNYDEEDDETTDCSENEINPKYVIEHEKEISYFGNEKENNVTRKLLHYEISRLKSVI